MWVLGLGYLFGCSFGLAGGCLFPGLFADGWFVGFPGVCFNGITLLVVVGWIVGLCFAYGLLSDWILLVWV